MEREINRNYLRMDQVFLEDLIEQELDIKKYIEKARAKYLRDVIVFLDDSEDSPLLTYGPQILEFAEREVVEPKWFYQEIKSVFSKINGSEIDVSNSQLEDETAEQRFTFALHIMQLDLGLGKRQRPIASSLRIATNLALKEEENTPSISENRMSYRTSIWYYSVVQ